MKRRVVQTAIALAFLCFFISACGMQSKTVKIGVSFGVGAAERWVHEKEYMEAQAEKLGVEIEVRLNRTDEPKTQIEDCIEMIDNGIDVLVLTPRDVNKVTEVLAYAKEKEVPVICYARVVLEEKVDLFVGYDSGRIGQKLGQYLSEKMDHGNYILLSGDAGDNNAMLLFDGAMQYIDPIRDNINVILETPVEGWSSDVAKKLVSEAIAANDGKIDAILSPNDLISGACAEVIVEQGITNHVVITGMDAQLDAVKRIVKGTQDITIYMDLEELATTAINEACHIAKGEKVNINAQFNNQSGETIDANLITGQLITKENLDKILIESGQFTKEEVYGE
ncbi:sugar ABC transporter substrate-binding protein [Hungatella hathewayi]|uniref:sugar ABC transporter substrate-binding protein n=1 Tax=Hungatella hathewayi TaxID=154046 RepID=UPI0035688769